MLYGEILKELNREKIKYIVAGGIACVAYGVVRFTKDLDLVVDFGDKNLDRFFRVMKKNGYNPKIPITVEDFKNAEKRKEWEETKGMLVLSFCHKRDFLKSIDVFTKEPVKFKTLFKNKKTIKTNSIKIPMVSIRDLKRLKRKAGRPQDRADIYALDEIIRIKRMKK